MNTVYKILFSILLITLLVAAIFFFSEQSGADSHTVSKSVSEKIADVWADTFWEVFIPLSLYLYGFSFQILQEM